jgi:hypothetical protein
MTKTIKTRFTGMNMSTWDWTMAITAKPKSMIASNTKLRKSRIHQFSLPAFKAAVVVGGKLVEMKTCPSAGECASFCYASQGTYVFNCSMVAHARNLQFYLSHKDAFKAQMIQEINKIRQLHAFRIHDSGDFFSKEYALDWFDIINALPHVQFYAYTKQVLMFNRLKGQKLIPSNLSLIYSFGGKADQMIDEALDRHSKVFASHEEMEAAGYADTTDTDDNAADPTKRCIGLVYHGKPKFSGSAVGEVLQETA